MKIEEGAGGIEHPGKPEERPQMPVNPDQHKDFLRGFEQGVEEMSKFMEAGGTRNLLPSVASGKTVNWEDLIDRSANNGQRS